MPATTPLPNAGLYGPEAILGHTGTPATTTPVTVHTYAIPTTTKPETTTATTSAATLYATRAKKSTIANPVRTDSFGNLTFYAQPGLYKLLFTVGGVTSTKTVIVEPYWSDSGYRLGQIITTSEAGTALPGTGVLIDGQWMVPDGTAISRTLYAKLFSVYGGATSPWGPGDGSTTFNLPDYRGRVLAQHCAVNSTAQPTITIGQVGGNTFIVLTVTQMPVHTHHITDGGHKHRSAQNGVGTVPALYADNASTQARLKPHTTGAGQSVGWSATNVDTLTATGVLAVNAGGGMRHQNMQPFAGIQRLVKVT